jgi:dinuclear metal center YbgI/SA1388 family protein
LTCLRRWQKAYKLPSNEVTKQRSHQAPKQRNSLLTLTTFAHRIAEILPPETAMNGDRIGVQLDGSIPASQHLRRVLVTMEVTDAVADEAVRREVDCILSFHPLIFAPLLSLTHNERVGRICTKLIRHGIALVVAHTNFDCFPDGTSALYARHLGLQVERVLIPDSTHDGFGMGIVATTDRPLSSQEFAALLHARTSAPLRMSAGSENAGSQSARSENTQSTIRRVAIVGGSGASFLDHAIASGADAFVTADLKYHDFHRAAGHIMLFDPGHYEMEQLVAAGLASVAEAVNKRVTSDEDSPIEILRSAFVPNPVRYYPDTERYEAGQKRLLEDA